LLLAFFAAQLQKCHVQLFGVRSLDLIINTASEPITYRFEDYGVVLTPVYPSKSATAPK